MPRRKREPISEGVRLACLDTVSRAVAKGTLLGIPGSMLLALVFGSTVPSSRRIAIIIAISLADFIAFWASIRFLRLRKRGVSITRYWPGPISAALVGLAWGLPALIALPDVHHVELRAVYLLFACGTSATSVVGAAARRSYFYATQITMLAPITIVFLASDDRTTTLLGWAIPIYFAAMASAHHDVHSVVVSELQLRESNGLANLQLVAANKNLQEIAARDDLTGFANRSAFMEHLERAVASARRDRSTIGLLYFDLDRFKVVNDSLGHGAGDELLIQVAHRVQNVLRTNDVLSRLGGDEFTVALDRLTDAYEALLIANRVAGTFITPFVIQGRRLNISASIGVATNIHREDDGETLLAHADAAQYRAKESGRNRVEVFDIALRDALERRLDNEQELRDALAAGDIVAYYQPQIEISTGRIVGAEALARWHHRERGVLGAQEFVPLAEESGLVFALDAEIIRQAVLTRVALAKAELAAPFRIWCNVSARQLTRGEPAQELAALLRETDCDPHGIGIEITETAVLPDVDAAQRQILIARALGVQCALDDFGTGHSSLTLLRELSIDKVKIDRSFVADLGIDPADTAIVRSVVALAQELGLGIVAEGVENEQQASLLTAMGCDQAQGYLWAPALPVDQFIARLYEQALIRNLGDGAMKTAA